MRGTYDRMNASSERVDDSSGGRHLRPKGALLLACWMMLASACSEAPEDPVATVSFAPSTLTLPHGGVEEANLRWDLLPGFPAGNDNLYVFVHLLDAAGEVVLTADHRLPSSEAQSFDDPVTLYHSAMAPPLRAGTYQLTVGLYEPQGERFALQGGEEVERQEYQVAEVTVPGAADTPKFEFSDTWTPVALGADRQVRAMRWLTAPGSITFQGGSGTLLLQVRLPEPAEGKQLLFEEGHDEPLVEVTACDSFQQTLRGFGSYRLEVPVSGDCEITLTPTFYWVDLQSFARSALLIEQAGLLGS